MPEPVAYQKHDSFVALHQQRLLVDDVLARIRRLRERLDAAGLSAEHAPVVQAACAELLDERPAGGEGAPFTLQSYVIEEISRLSEVQLPRYLWYRYRYEIYPQRKLLDSFPPCLQIEPASVCNYRCVFCYQTDREFTNRRNGQMGTMTLDLFKQIIDQAEGSCEAVTLASRGEPLLCPDIETMLAYARGKFLAMKLNTNASLLTERLCHAILETELNTVVFSADAAVEPSYGQLRVGGRLEPVLANVRQFHEIRQRHYSGSRTITRVSGVNVDGASSMDDMEAFWGGIVDQVAFVAYNPWENTYQRPVNDIPTPCSDLWRRMFVWWDGTINPCDVDYRSTLAAGQAREHRLSDVWQGERYTALRTAHLQRQRSGVSPCNRCTVV